MQRILREMLVYSSRLGGFLHRLAGPPRRRRRARSAGDVETHQPEQVQQHQRDARPSHPAQLPRHAWIVPTRKCALVAEPTSRLCPSHVKLMLPPAQELLHAPTKAL